MNKVFLGGFLVATALLTACAGSPHLVEGETKDGLSPVAGVNVDEAFVALDIDVDGFKSFYVEPLDASTTEVNFRPDSRIYPRGEWVMTDKDRQRFAKQYREAMTNALLAKGFNLVDTPAEGVLQVKSQLVEIAPLAPKDDFKSRDVTKKYVSQGAGSLTMALQLHDGADDRLLVSVEDKRVAGYRWQRNTRFNNQHEVRLVFSGWAKQFASQMSKIHEGYAASSL